MQDGPDVDRGPGSEADAGGVEPAAEAGRAMPTPDAMDGSSGSDPRSTDAATGADGVGETPIWVFFAAAGALVLLALLVALSQAH